MWIKNLFRKNRNQRSRDIVKNIGELHEKYIKLFIDLHTHITVVDADFYIAAQAALTEQYQAELDLLRAEARHLNEEKFYLAESRTAALGIFSYRRWFKKYDSVMKQILDERIAREAEGYFNEYMAATEPSPEEQEEEKSPAETEEQKEPADSSEDTETSEEVEGESLELLVKYVNESDDLSELYELEEDFHDDSSIITPEEAVNEPEQLNINLVLPETVSSERNAEMGDIDEEPDNDNNEK